MNYIPGGIGTFRKTLYQYKVEPPDHASRGLNADDLLLDRNYLRAPWALQPENQFEFNEREISDPEIKVTVVKVRTLGYCCCEQTD